MLLVDRNNFSSIFGRINNVFSDKFILKIFNILIIFLVLYSVILRLSNIIILFCFEINKLRKPNFHSLRFILFEYNLGLGPKETST